MARPYEIVVVDEASTDDTPGVLTRKGQAGLPVRHVRHERGMGQSGAIRTGVIHARGSILVTIDGDGQNDPAYIPSLVTTLEGAGADVGMVAGQRRGRTDGTLKKIRFALRQQSAPLAAERRQRGFRLRVESGAAPTSSASCPSSTAGTGSCRRWSLARATRS